MSLAIEYRAIDELIPFVNNARTHNDEQVAQIAASIKEFGWTNPILVDDGRGVIAGHGRLMAARKLGYENVPTIDLEGLSDAQKRAYILADNKLAENAGWDNDLLKIELGGLDDEGFDLSLIGFSQIDLNNLLNDQKPKGSLSDKFGAPPFSVLNAREGWWQDRKREWLSLGIESELGRGEELLGFRSLAARFGNRGGTEANTSVFDPVLCELLYQWFSPMGGVVLDPFAGGSVRGVVAAELGREYVGYELRADQINANKRQASRICSNIVPAWVNADSRGIDKAKIDADFVFSCPPYADLEKYSDDPKDLSTLEYKEFLPAYREIIAKACAKLKEGRFACFVVGEVRDQGGNYRNFVSDTIDAFLSAGLSYYNEIILVTAVGSLPVRSGRVFEASRKIGKTHQNVLVFVKGDGKEATLNLGPVQAVQEFPDYKKEVAE